MADVHENLAELFFSRLKTAPNPGVVLAQFYGNVMGLEVGRSEIIMFSKLVKMFGKSSVFFSVIDVSRIETPTEFPYGLLFKICKTKLEKSLESDMALTSMYSLERKISDLQKEVAKTKKIDPDKATKYLDGNDEK
jgi:hypothetical protein